MIAPTKRSRKKKGQRETKQERVRISIANSNFGSSRAQCRAFDVCSFKGNNIPAMFCPSVIKSHDTTAGIPRLPSVPRIIPPTFFLIFGLFGHVVGVDQHYSKEEIKRIVSETK